MSAMPEPTARPRSVADRAVRSAARLALVLVAALHPVQPAYAAEATRILVFTRTEGYRHDSIPDGVAMLQIAGALRGWAVDATESTELFTAAGLATYDVVVWLNTTGDVLDRAQQDAFAAWVESGGGYLGIHAAADCEYNWPWYGALLGNGAWFESHPAVASAQLRRELADDPSTVHLPERFELVDEWYNFRSNPRPAATVLLTLDESSYAPGPGAMGQDHPISWRRHQGEGRAWYTGMGHERSVYADMRFTGHVIGGIEWLLGPGGATVFADSFEAG